MSVLHASYIDGKPYKGHIESFNIFPRSNMLLRRNALLFMQTLFTKINEMKYDPDDELSAIHILDSNTDILKTSDMKPKIITLRQDSGWENTGGIGNRLERPLLRDEKTVYSDMVRGSCIIGCYAREDFVAEEIAEFVFASFKFFQHKLKGLGFMKLVSTSTSAPYKVKADPNPIWWGINVHIMALMQEKWALEATNKKLLSEIILAVEARISGKAVTEELSQDVTIL